MSESPDTISIPAHLITDNATLALSGSTIILEFPTTEDAEAVRDCLMGEDGDSLTVATMEELKRHFGTKTSAETFRAALKAAKAAAEAIVSPEAFAYHDDVTPEGIAAVRARAEAHRPAGPWKVIEGYVPAPPEAGERAYERRLTHRDLVAFYDQHVGTPCEEVRHREQVRQLHRRVQKAEGKLLRFGRPYLLNRLAHYIGQRSLDRRRVRRAEDETRAQHTLAVQALAMVLFLGMSMSDRQAAA